jgi:hypothetical protein
MYLYPLTAPPRCCEQMLVSIALILNIAIGYVLMLAPSRQYIEAAALGTLSAWLPDSFSSNHSSYRLKLDLEAKLGGGGIELTTGSDGGSPHELHRTDRIISEEEIELAEEEESGVWVLGGDNWSRAVVRNVIRTLLVLFTAQVALTIPHFALVTGREGGSWKTNL